MKKVGIYGGTFDPIHFGHLNLAVELKERVGLDEVWWIPAARSPLRGTAATATIEQRQEMVRLATAGIAGFKVLDVDMYYTFDTLKALLAQFPQEKFYLMMSRDLLTQYMSWKEPLALAQLLPFLIGERKGEPTPPLPPEIADVVAEGTIETSQLDISATSIRERLKKKLYCGHLVPEKVLDFIYVNQLYFTA